MGKSLWNEMEGEWDGSKTKEHHRNSQQRKIVQKKFHNVIAIGLPKNECKWLDRKAEKDKMGKMKEEEKRSIAKGKNPKEKASQHTSRIPIQRSCLHTIIPLVFVFGTNVTAPAPITPEAILARSVSLAPSYR